MYAYDGGFYAKQHFKQCFPFLFLFDWTIIFLFKARLRKYCEIKIKISESCRKLKRIVYLFYLIKSKSSINQYQNHTYYVSNFQMEVELQQFNNERVERIKHLHEKHERETEVFDEESTRKGFRQNDNKLNFAFMKLMQLYIFSVLAINEASRETYPDEESLSGSMISLAHSNSSTSFPAGSLQHSSSRSS